MADQTRTRNVIPALSGLYQALSPWMEPLLRFIAGAMLVPHGCQKLFGIFGGGGLVGTAQTWTESDIIQVCYGRMWSD